MKPLLVLFFALVFLINSCGTVTVPSQKHVPTKVKPKTILQPAHIQSGFNHLGLPIALEGGAAASYKGLIYYFGGYGRRGSSNRIFSWTRHHQTRVGKLPRPLHDGAAATSGSFIYYVAGGSNKHGMYAGILRFNPRTKKIQTFTHLPVGLSDVSVVVSGSKLYVIGGFSGTVWSKKIYQVDLQSGKVSILATLPIGIRYTATAVLNHALYVFGGLTASGPTASSEKVSLTTGKVSVIASLPTPLLYHQAMAFGNSVILVGGANQGFSANVYAYRPKHGYQLLGHLPQPQGYAPLVRQKKILYLLGGETKHGLTNQVIWLQVRAIRLKS